MFWAPSLATVACETGEIQQGCVLHEGFSNSNSDQEITPMEVFVHYGIDVQESSGRSLSDAGDWREDSDPNDSTGMLSIAFLSEARS